MLEIIYILIISMLPVVELRGAIPVAMTVFDFSAPTALLLAIIGNMIPVFFLIPLIGKINNFLAEKSEFWKQAFLNLLERTENNNKDKFIKLKEFALVVLVAIPLPFTGVWTASLVACVFGIPFRKAVPLIFVGVAIAGTIVVLVTMGIITLFSI